jgi:hypothetical protein
LCFDDQPVTEAGELVRSVWADWLAVGISIVALVFSGLAYYRTVGDELEISEGRVGFLDGATNTWQLLDTDSGSQTISAERWAGSVPGSQWVQVKVYNDGVADIQLAAVGLVYNATGGIFGFGESDQSIDLTGRTPRVVHCATTAYAVQFVPCPDSLKQKQAQYVRITLDPGILRQLTEGVRDDSLQFWITVGSGPCFYDTDITLPPNAFA